MEKFHPYHMVNMSPWPLMIGFSMFSMMMGMIKMMVFIEYNLLLMSLLMLVMISMIWWRDMIRESTFQGNHCSIVLNGLMLGMILFIVSEVFFFFSFFWGFFHSSLSPGIELGSVWPSKGINSFNPFQVPLLNTVILLSSGITITWCHQMILMQKMEMSNKLLMVTWILGIYFLMLQGLEYYFASFGISDSVFGSVFFMSTGFHGSHVIIGTLFLMIMWFRILSNHFSNSHHFGFEAAAWYWHFVDVVWLFLFSVIYWWGNWFINMLNMFNFQLNKELMYLILIIISCMLVLLMYMLFYMYFYKNMMGSEMKSAYECGFDSSSVVRMTFSYRFYLISILFVIFDVEITLLLSVPFLMNMHYSMWLFLMFMLLLIIGLIYEYFYGALNWLNIMIKS